MKRYRVLGIDFDSRAAILGLEIKEEWDERVKAHHHRNKEIVRVQLIREFGEGDAASKLQNLADLGPKPFSILAFHNKFLEQVRRAFIIGAYYPALTGACALGERILNHLMLLLREDFKRTKEYKKVYRKASFADWTLAIDTLESWKVLLAETVEKLRELAQIRNRVIHFHPETDTNDRELALTAISVLQDLIQEQFGGMGKQPWFIPGSKGETYIKKSMESDPFVKRVYLPRCALLSPSHLINIQGNTMTPTEFNRFGDRDVSDDEFVNLRHEWVETEGVKHESDKV